MNIRLHPEHGLNPSLVACFFCGKDRGEIALLGSNKGKEAPRHVVLDYEPCATCKENMSRGITLLEATEHPTHENQMALNENVYPTGRWLVITEDAAKRMFGPSELADQICKRRKAFVEPAAFEQMISGISEPGGHA